jgi:hypothetical protein
MVATAADRGATERCFFYKVLSYSELMGDYFGAIFTGFMGRW